MINISENDSELLEWVYEYSLKDYLMNLLNTSSFEGRLRDQMEMEINNDMSKEDYDKIIFKLFANQLDRITSGLNYSATDILKHLRKLN